MAQTIHAAGAVVWRQRGRSLEVLLIHRPAYSDWSWPKGKPDKRETLPACAVREVKEETGVDVVLGAPLPAVRYHLSNGKQKVNWYWAAQVAGAHAAAQALPEVEPAPPSEVDETVWVDAVTALTMLTRRSDREPLKVLLDLYADEQLCTWALLVTRHGLAKKRSAWDGEELTRPLTPTGEKQARTLVAFFAAYGATRITSSPWRRCTMTVEPFAAAAGLEVGTAQFLTENGAKQDPKSVRKLITRVLNSEVNTVLCTHRPVLPSVLKTVRKRTPYRVQEKLPENDPYLRTGEVLVLHLAPRPGKRPRVIAAETHRAPR